MTPYEILHKVCGDSWTLPSGRKVFVQPDKDECFVDGRYYPYFYLFAGRGCCKYPQDKAAISMYWKPKSSK